MLGRRRLKRLCPSCSQELADAIGRGASVHIALVGASAIQSVSEMFVDKIFMGVDGIHPEHGLTTNYPDQAAIHRQMLRQARFRVVVADHRKLGVTGTTLIWPTAEIDLLITDKGASKAALAPFISKGIKVQTV